MRLPRNTIVVCVVLLTSRNHILMFKAVFVGSLGGWIVIHPDFTIVAPEHGVGLPKLHLNTVLGHTLAITTPMHMALPQSFLIR